MVARPARPAFYAPARGGRLADAVTLLHPPYTVWHLSYFALGAAVAPHVYVGRLLWGLAAFALAVGVAAHALDELHDRPLRTGFSDTALRAAAALSLLGAVAIGIGGIVTVSPWLAPLIIAGGLLVPAYNLELGGGRFHGDLWFALGWGAFPAFTGYFVNARELRRRTADVRGVRERTDGSSEQLSVGVLLGPIDGALAVLSLTVPLLAAAALAAKL
jgi:hypothetical protein